MILRPFLHAPTSCASYLFGCTTHAKLAVVNPHAELVGAYLAEAERAGSPIVAVFETHVHADHPSGTAALVRETGADVVSCRPAPGRRSRTAPLDDLDEVVLGNTVVRALATPGHAPAHHAYLVADRRRGATTRGSPSPATPCWWARPGGPTSTPPAGAGRWPGGSTPRSSACSAWATR